MIVQAIRFVLMIYVTVNAYSVLLALPDSVTHPSSLMTSG